MTSSKEVVIIALLLTVAVMYKRWFDLSTLHDFELTFGRGLLQPRLRLFFVITAFIMMLPFNAKVGDKVYKEATGYYTEMQNKREYMSSLKDSPIKTLALEDPERTSKYLEIPLWLAEYISVFAHKSFYVIAGVSCTFLILTSVLLWKIMT